MQNAFSRGSQQLKHSGTPISINSPDVVERQADALKNVFKLITVYHSGTKALFWLINEPMLLPPFEENNQRSFSLIDHVSRIYPQFSGHVTSLGPNSDLSNEYAQNMLRTRVLISGIIYELIEDGWINEGHFFELLNMIPGVSVDNLWYLTDAVNHLFDKEYAASIHIGVPRLETTLYEVLNHLGNDVVRQMDGGTGTRTLTPLLEELTSYVGSDFHRYLELAYAEKEGEVAGGNVRNRVSHGHLQIGEDDHTNAILPLVDILRVCYCANPTPFVARFGFPSYYVYLANQVKLNI